ncbi:hypothetical protein [Vibrio porteresiae]|uniref:Uncharacterized protein n=1 Tax=Vibrio porteresiae DSM 19223 TaxID=1123496 RepID=A0ABZ0QD27_9VIBR|nr:hypothetical protein [Vibrio porteresiae]WPC74314.1 hypothetical protein R8Z52_03350 [Vibrio porteresiae DSM 19223]
MFKYIALILIVIGIYIGVQYKDEITGVVGNDRMESIQEQVNDTIENGKQALSDKIDEIKK